MQQSLTKFISLALFPNAEILMTPLVSLKRSNRSLENFSADFSIEILKRKAIDSFSGNPYRNN
jgi:uncharacterized membrane protein